MVIGRSLGSVVLVLVVGSVRGLVSHERYKQAKVLILDEATSALDTGTEEAVMNSIDSPAKI